MADNHIIANEKEAKLLKQIMNDWWHMIKGSNHLWEENKYTYSTLRDKVNEAIEFHEKSQEKHRNSDSKRTVQT